MYVFLLFVRLNFVHGDTGELWGILSLPGNVDTGRCAWAAWLTGAATPLPSFEAILAFTIRQRFSLSQSPLCATPWAKRLVQDLCFSGKNGQSSTLEVLPRRASSTGAPSPNTASGASQGGAERMSGQKQSAQPCGRLDGYSWRAFPSQYH
mmetsp:Transcript_16341/g.38795  ORF Transcript_16341/g.38795 Transcript_16341/m.38795 type:complete len:151 (+) Transcript_16341:880-1332(+)